MDLQELVRQADDAELRLVRFLWCGNDGTIRAKASGRHGLEGRLARGIGVTRAMQAMNGLDQLQPIEGLGPVGEFRLVPDLDSFRVLPYAPASGAVLTDHMEPDGTPADVCQRGFLKRMERRLAERGLVFRAAFENEFSLTKEKDGRFAPVDEALCFSTLAMAISQDFADKLVAALTAQRIHVQQFYTELGHGQQELSVAPASALQAADEQLLVRETIRAVAKGCELTASLAPKPWLKDAGNGTHVHFSLWEGERNRFYDEGFSSLGLHFLAGVLEHLPALCGLTAPSFNSYRRIAPGTWSGAYACWGFDNREAPLRVPSTFLGDEEASTNIELKACDASCNPYLALGGLIAAGLDGIDRELEPPEPVQVDPATLEGEAPARMPATQQEALDALAADEVLMGALGEVLGNAYLTVRRSEWTAYSEKGDAAFEQTGHFEKY
jgi:glutamine synthetase